MASVVANGLQKAIHSNDVASNNPKLAEMERDTMNSEDTNARSTTD